jgi:hypothetical protein
MNINVYHFIVKPTINGELHRKFVYESGVFASGASP